MELLPEGPDINDWLSDAACLGTRGRVTWDWSETPNDTIAAPALSVCASCPVVAECRMDMAITGERYRNQVRGGLRMWVDQDVALIPDPPTAGAPPEPEPRPNGRPQGPLPTPRSKGYALPPTGTKFNPHTRGLWNT